MATDMGELSDQENSCHAPMQPAFMHAFNSIPSFVVDF
jgi:hypothetical protein